MKLTKAQIKHVESLEDASGSITAERVLADAKRTASPLHSLFDWDAKKAARQHWLHIARKVIGAVQYEHKHHNTVVLKPTYVNLPGANGRGYQRIDALREDPEQSRTSLIYTLEVASGHLRRAFDLAGPLGLQREIDSLLVQVAGVQRIAKAKAA